MSVRKLSAVALAELLGTWSGRGPAYANLASALRQLVQDGRLPLAAHLPGERTFAAALGVSRTTVTAAYTRLRDEGYLTTQRGARSVTALPPGSVSPGFPASGSAPAGLLDLAFATLPASEQVSRAYAEALRSLSAHLPSHGYAPHGLPVLREAIAERYSRRGLATNAEQIVVTFGAQHAFSLLLRVLVSAGDRVVVDQPTYPHALDALRGASCRVVPVALNAEGWDVSAVRAAFRQTAPRLAYLIPDFHNPTGWCMPEPQRAAVARAAAESRTTLIIDETLADLALDVPVPRPFARHVRSRENAGAEVVGAEFAGAEVISIGSLSKTFWGGLRVGWIRAKGALVDRVMGSRSTVDLGAPILEQLTAAALLTDEMSDPTLEARRDTLRRQRAALTQQLAKHLPDWRYPVPTGGLSFWVTLPAPVSSALAATAERHGVRVAAGSHFGSEGLFERQLRVPFTLPETDLEEAVLRLSRAYAALGSSTPESGAARQVGKAMA